MVIVVQDEGTGKQYRIEPTKDGEGFRLLVNDPSSKKGRNGKAKKHDWQPTGKYPHDIGHGLWLIAKMTLESQGGEITVLTDVADIKRYKSAIAKINDAIDDRLSELEASCQE